MYKEGHVGFSLIFLSIAMYLTDSWDEMSLITALIALVFSTFPDLDLKIGVGHRKYTHSFLFALIFGILTGLITYKIGFGFYPGFLGAFAGINLHIIADLMTYRRFAPLWPVSNKKFSLGLFRSDNRYVNRVLLIAGLISFVLLYDDCFILSALLPK